MVMENVEGLDFATLLEACKRSGRELFLPLALHVVYEAAKGLDYAHKKCDERGQRLGLVHRDVSPQNILLSWEGEVKLTDFGVATAQRALPAAEDEEPESRLHGKFSYMSPEQARGESLDATSDLFSLGTVLFEAITSTQPFMAPTQQETLRRVAACEYPPIDLVKPDLPEAVVQVVQGAMAKAPGDRFRSAGHLADAIAPLLSSERTLKRALAGVIHHANVSGALEGLGGENGQRTPTEVAPRRRSSTMRVRK
jgi:serine/threonine protein kinase